MRNQDQPKPVPPSGQKERRFQPMRHLDSFCAKHAFNRAAVLLTLILILALILTLGGISLMSRHVSVSSRTVEFGLRNIGELATQAGYYTSVQTINGSRELFGVTIPFTQSKYIYSYDGIVKAGVDFESVSVTLNDEEKKIVVSMPKAKILDVTIDEKSLVVYDETRNIYSPLKLNDFNDSLSSMKEEVTEKALHNGMLTAAEKNAETLITGFLMGMLQDDQYVFEFKWEQ